MTPMEGNGRVVGGSTKPAALAWTFGARDPTAGLARRPSRILREWLERSGAKRRRLLKIGVAVGLFGAGVWAVLADSLTLTTEHAVVSAYTFGLRSPIGGQLSGLQADPGAEVDAGAPLGLVKNDRVYRQRLEELRSQHGRLRAEREATETQRHELRRMAEELEQRSIRHRRVAISWYGFQVAEAERVLRVAEVRLARDRVTLERRRRRLERGYSSRADYDLARADHDVAVSTAEAQRNRIAALTVQRNGAAQGLFVDTGHAGTAYSQQRRDEVLLRLADLDRAVATLTAEEGGTLARLQAEEWRVAQLASAVLAAPTGGVLWRVLANAGERVAPGDTVAEVMDCHSAFVLAAVPQDRAGEVRAGGIARFRLLGEARERSGRVQAVLAEGAAGPVDRNLAALPPPPARGGSLIRVTLGSPEGSEGAECPVGRVARMVLPTRKGGLLGRAIAMLH